MPAPPARPVTPFSPYQKLVAGLLAFLQFAVILDFMIVAPLGAIVMPALQITPRQFGLVVSAYAFSAGLSGLLTAGFADRFDRKRLLLFFYAGFMVGTLWCGLAQSFEALLAARIFTGLFGGVIGSIVMAIITDLFPPEMRGRVMGIVNTAFAASQVLGLPIGLFLATHWDWHMPFFAMVAIGLLGGAFVAARMRPVDGHLALRQEHSPFRHLLNTIADGHHLTAFLSTAFLTTGGFMLMPFSSDFAVNNIGVSTGQLPWVYLATGLSTIVFGPLIGRASDTFGKLRVFLFGGTVTMVLVTIYTHLGHSSLALLIVVNVVMFVGIFSRMIPFQAMVSQVPQPERRGAFNAINSSIQQLAGGLASLIAGHIVARQADGQLAHMDIVGYVVIASTLASMVMVSRIHGQLQARAGKAAPAAQAPQPAADNA